MLSLNWPLVILTTGIIYILIIITLPFSVVYATIFLFALISFWSRLPGAGIQFPFFILYLADFVDLFGLIISVNIGGVYGGIFTLVINLWSRLSGSYPIWYIVFEDAIAQFFVCLLIPFFHVALGGNILVSMVIYTILRIIIISPSDLISFPGGFVPWFFTSIRTWTIAFLINIFYAKYFGDFLNHLLLKGVAFSWSLFFFVTIIIIIFYINVFSKPKSSKNNLLNKLLIRIIKKILNSRKH